MKFEGVSKIHEGKFLTRYDLKYVTEDGKDKVYEMVSRNKDLKTLEDVQNKGIDAVVLIIWNESHDSILIDREFRPAAGQEVYNFPAGLIEKGESVEEAAARELKEETGLTLTKIEGYLSPCFSAVSFANEKNVCVIGTAAGDFAPSSSSFEEIKAGWYTKEEVRELLQNKLFTARTQTWCYLWVNGF
ncbi:MAG: NUDIX hydrolase [Lachnospiraceae bacterium]|nr:NUDIX hydrolase [Lachnospiraceae bacterium]